MGLFKYPYTDLNELNLDWVIARIKELTEYVATITNADQISYDNTGTVLSAENVQAAITELQTIITTASVVSFNGRTGAVVPAAGDYVGSDITYDNTNSGLAATDSQGAIDELAARPLGGVESFNSRTGAVVPTAGDYGASDVTYDNTGSGLAATNVQGAIDEVDNKIPATIVESFNTRTGAVLPAAGDYEAEDITYDNTVSGLTATDTQAAIDELDNRLDNFSVNASQVSYDNTQSGLTATDAQAAIDEIANDVLSSGVASFNGRTGAVNPQAGDYDASDITYDNTGSGLTATDTQSAIDEIEASLNSGLLGFKETITVTNNAYADTNAVRLADLEAQIITALGQLASDEKALINNVSVANAIMPRVYGPATWFTNATTTLDMRFMITSISTANNRADFQMVRLHPNSANTFYNRLRVETTPAVTVTDFSSSTNSNDMIAYIDVYKEVIS